MKKVTFEFPGENPKDSDTYVLEAFHKNGKKRINHYLQLANGEKISIYSGTLYGFILEEVSKGSATKTENHRTLTQEKINKRHPNVILLEQSMFFLAAKTIGVMQTLEVAKFTYTFEQHSRTFTVTRPSNASTKEITDVLVQLTGKLNISIGKQIGDRRYDLEPISHGEYTIIHADNKSDETSDEKITKSNKNSIPKTKKKRRAKKSKTKRKKK